MVGRPLGEILRAIAGLSEAALEEALRTQADEGGRLGEVLVAKKAVSTEDVAKALALQLAVAVFVPPLADGAEP